MVQLSAELERSLFAERVRTGLQSTKAKGRRLGRPRVDVDVAKIGGLPPRADCE
jgi:DNA invertase Pin-like site-specific DNA recombinase